MVVTPDAGGEYPGATMYIEYDIKPWNPVAGKKFKLIVYATNYGYQPLKKGSITSAWATYAGSGPEACGAKGDTQVKVPVINPGQSKKLAALTLTAPAAAGKAVLAWVFDSNCVNFQDTKVRECAPAALGAAY
jgi:hypothetical protein